MTHPRGRVRERERGKKALKGNIIKTTDGERERDRETAGEATSQLDLQSWLKSLLFIMGGGLQTEGFESFVSTL